MDKATVFTKTAKGITQVNQRSASLSKDLMKVLKLIDGKSNFGQLIEKAELDKTVLERALNTLTKDGYARIFETKKEEADPFADEDEFDFTAPKKAGGLPGATQRVVPAAANDVGALAAQQKKAEEDRKAREAAHEAARKQAQAQAEARARAEAEAKARQQAEQAAMEQARRAKEAAERAKAELEQKMREEEARKQALAAAQAKQAAEHKAREEEEQRKLAELRAKAEKEANERSRKELEAKVREEEARKKAAAEQQARDSAAQKAREEEEARKLAEIRVKAEHEAKALAEARARAEAEAAAMAKARAEAEAAAKRQAADAAAAEADMKARLKEEIEARIRQEMEDLLRNEVEEKTRAEMQASIMAEAKLAAKAELEERLREEREAIAKAEAEAAQKAERDASARAEMESKKRAEAEARAKAESEARIRAEEEAKQLRAQAEEQARKAKEFEAKAKADAEAAAAHAKQEAEARAREAVVAAEARAKQEAEARARVQADADARVRKEAEERERVEREAEERVKAERQAKYEAEARAKLDAEEREKRERALSATLDAERKAKEEAEQRARMEAKARETVEADTRAKVQAELETDLAKKAEIEGKAQAKAYMEAKVKAEADEDERLRAEQAKRAREIADVLRTKVEPDAAAPEEGGTPARRKVRRKSNLVRNLAFALVGGLVLAVIAVHVIPMRGLANKVEKALAVWLNDDVSIASTTFRLVPSPHLNIQNLAVGKALDAKAATGRIYVDLGSLLGDKVTISSVELDGVTIGSEAVRRILPVWAKADGKAAGGGIGTIRLSDVRMDVRPEVDPFNATLSFGSDGAFKSASLNARVGWSLAVRPAEKGMDLDFTARNWKLPIGAPIAIGDVRLKGTLVGNEIVVPEFEASAMEGKVNGTLKASWQQGVRLESDLSVERMSAGALIGAFTKDISVTGRFDGNFAFSTEGPNVEGLFTNPRVQGKFRLGEGSISNVDLVAVMQSDSASGRAGVTKFNEVTGEFASVNKGASYRQVNLQGGVLRGNGQVDIGNNSALSGRVNLEIRSQVAQDRGAFAVSGTVARPIVRRGG